MNSPTVNTSDREPTRPAMARRRGDDHDRGSGRVGLLLVLTAATLGSCGAFGGRCPADRPSLWKDDVFGMAAFGTALIVVVPAFVRRPSWRRLGWAVAAGAASALVVGLLVADAAHG